MTVLSGPEELVAIVLAEKDHWEQDLTQVPPVWSSRLLMTLDAILEKGCAKLYARCANTLNPVSTGFLILTILVTTSYAPLSLTGATCSTC